MSGSFRRFNLISAAEAGMAVRASNAAVQG